MAVLQKIDEDDFVDLVVECSDNRTVKAHRVILSMHSRTLHQLLSLPGIEQRLELPAIRREDFLLMKQLMYKGTVIVEDSARNAFMELLDEFGIENCTGMGIGCEDSLNFSSKLLMKHYFYLK